jgi:hypothetical protein
MHFRRVTVAVLTVAALLACDEATPGGTGPTADAERDAQRPRQDQYIAREDGSIRDSEPGDVPDVPELPDLDLPPDAEAVDDGPTGGTPPPVDAARLEHRDLLERLRRVEPRWRRQLDGDDEVAARHLARSR